MESVPEYILENQTILSRLISKAVISLNTVDQIVFFGQNYGIYYPSGYGDMLVYGSCVLYRFKQRLVTYGFTPGNN
jgi:hypothetical protein